MAGATGRALNGWRDLSDQELSAVSLTACAENIQWLLDRQYVEEDRLVVEGWAITMSGRLDKAQFLINGIPIEEVHYPIPSPDVGEVFWNIPTAQTARFVCKTTVNWEHTYQNGFACLEFLTESSDREKVRRRAWYLPNPMNDLPVPEEARIRRAIGVPDSASFVIGGAAVYKRLEQYLKEKFSRTFDDFSDILDWACGCGRVARNFRWAREAKLWGVDIDPDNIAWCRKHLRHAQFLQIPPSPPLPFPAESFDLVMAISAFGQLTEELQFAWLQELKRVARKDAIVMVAIRGLSNIGLIRPDPGLLRKVEEEGFLVTGPNSDLDDVMPGHTYVSVLHSRDYLRANWERYFTITDIVDAIAANDDLIVLKNDKSAKAISVILPAPDPEIEAGRENPFALPTISGTDESAAQTHTDGGGSALWQEWLGCLRRRRPSCTGHHPAREDSLSWLPRLSRLVFCRDRLSRHPCLVEGNGDISAGAYSCRRGRGLQAASQRNCGVDS